MAKYTVRMSCGHEQEVELFGKHSERRKKIDFFENSGLCKECYKKKRQEKQESETFSFHVSVSTATESNVIEVISLSGIIGLSLPPEPSETGQNNSVPTYILDISYPLYITISMLPDL